MPSYCRAAHALLAGHGMVPALHCCVWHSALGGLFAVIMDWVNGDGNGATYDITTHGAMTLAAVQALHPAGFVWSDARCPNVIVRSGGDSTAVMLINFDWSGRGLVAAYRFLISGATGKAITKEHDFID